MIGYAYLPTTILARKVIEKILVSTCNIILIAPAWPTQAWYQDLLSLSVDHPLKLPEWGRLLKQTGKNFFHTNPSHLKLHAWRLKNVVSGKEVFLEKCLRECYDHKESPQETNTSSNGEFSALGVSKGMKILSKPLYH